MTTPGGVPNLPTGALTVSTLGQQLQDQSAAAHRSRAGARFPEALLLGSTGGNVMSDASPFGVIVKIWSEVNSRIATADPADIQGPADLPGLFTDFVESLPVIGQFVQLLEAISGTYDGEDEVLQAIQEINQPLRKILQLLTGSEVGWPTQEEVESGWEHLFDAVLERIQGVIDNIYNAFANLGAMLDLENPLSSVVEAILGIFDTSRGAASKAAGLESRIRALESTANAIVIDFNGPAGATLPSSAFDVRRFGGGAGSIGYNGKGDAIWKPSGAGNRTEIARYIVDSPSVDYIQISAVLATTPQQFIFDDAYTYLPFRMNAAKTTMMRLQIGYNTITLQAVVSDAVTNIGSPVNCSPKAGNEIDIWAGDLEDNEPRRFRIALNRREIIDEIDTAAVSQIGSGFRGVGLGMETGNYLVVTQNIPAGLSVVTITEVV